MILKSAESKVQRAFSKSAGQYENLSVLQRKIGEGLLKEIQLNKACGRILDIGMGTGWLTNRMSLLFPHAQVVGMDFAPGMTEYARRNYDTFQSVQADAAHLPFRDNIFDTVVSNLAYQWLNNLEEAFKLCYSALKEGGVFYLTMFGQKTMQELFEALKNSSGRENPAGQLSIKRLPAQNEILEGVRNAGFKDLKVQNETVQICFEDMLALVKWLKSTGANAMRKEFFVGRNRLLQANAYYNKNFRDRRGVYASFELISIRAKKQERVG